MQVCIWITWNCRHFSTLKICLRTKIKCFHVCLGQWLFVKKQINFMYHIFGRTGNSTIITKHFHFTNCCVGWADICTKYLVFLNIQNNTMLLCFVFWFTKQQQLFFFDDEIESVFESWLPKTISHLGIK